MVVGVVVVVVGVVVVMTPERKIKGNLVNLTFFIFMMLSR